jgi:hypothetical protein
MVLTVAILWMVALRINSLETRHHLDLLLLLVVIDLHQHFPCGMPLW